MLRRGARARNELDWSLLHERLGFNLHRANTEMRKHFLEATREWGLLPPHFSTLALLECNADLTPADIGAALFMQPPNVATLLATLEEQRLIKRTVAADDRRRIVLSVTAKGRRLRARMTHRLAEQEHAMLEGFGPAERATLNDMLRRFGRVAEEDDTP